MRVTAALALGLALIATALAVVVSRSPLVPAGRGHITSRTLLGYTTGNDTICQGGETIPAGTSAVRLALAANIGPRVTFAAYAGSRVLTRGAREAGWGIDETVTVPVRAISRTVQDARVCTTIGAAIGRIEVLGAIGRVRRSGGGYSPSPEIEIEYLRRGRGSWWSRASSIARRMGLGRAPRGAWDVVLVVLLTAALVVLVCGLIFGELGGRGRLSARDLRGVPVAGWICALAACLSAASWSLLTPPFQVTDEPAHFAYVQGLAETGRLPTSSRSSFAPAEEVVLRDLHQGEVRWFPERGTISTGAQERRLWGDLEARPSRRPTGDAGVAASQPPLYYALEAIPYGLGAGGTLLDQLALMRLLSALLAGVTAFFCYLFVREVLPGVRWAWTVGGLGAALTPLFGFMSGAVNPDALLYAVSAALFYVLARGLRRGLTRLAAALGAVSAVGLLTKLNFLGLVPGAILGLLVLAVRAVRANGSARTRGSARASGPAQTNGTARTSGTTRARAARGDVCRSLALAVAIALAPLAVYATVNLLSRRSTLGLVSHPLSASNPQGSLLGEVVYIWELYLPRLPGMALDFPGLSPIHRIWFDRLVGQYGWLDTSFPVWAENLVLVLAAPIAMLALRALLLNGRRLRGRGAELAVYGVMSVGVMALVGADSYAHLQLTSGGFVEPRYLLPMLPLLGAALALGARGAGRRWGPPVGTLIVLGLLALDVFAQLQVVSRYYG
jgi:hypothetical protein